MRCNYLFRGILFRPTHESLRVSSFALRLGSDMEVFYHFKNDENGDSNAIGTVFMR